jgi:hypothetical protein
MFTGMLLIHLNDFEPTAGQAVFRTPCIALSCTTQNPTLSRQGADMVVEGVDLELRTPSAAATSEKQYVCCTVPSSMFQQASKP